MVGVSTYQGEMESPRAFDINAELPVLRFEAKTAEDLAEYLFDISAAAYNGEDIRVCSIAGVCSVEGTWNLHIINQHQE